MRKVGSGLFQTLSFTPKKEIAKQVGLVSGISIVIILLMAGVDTGFGSLMSLFV